MNRDFQQRVYWQATAAPLPSYTATPVPESADVVVVGAGYTGISAALHLAEGGAKVVVVEARSVGWGASSRNGGQIRIFGHESPSSIRRKYGADIGDRMFRYNIKSYSLVGREVKKRRLECDYQDSPYLTLAWSRRQADRFEDELEGLIPYGITGRVIRGPALHEVVGTSYYHGGIALYQAATVHPAKFLFELTRAAVAAGAVICEEAGALALSDGPPCRVETARGPIRADQVVIATGAHPGSLRPWLQRRVIPVGSYIVVTEPLDRAVAASISPRGYQFEDGKTIFYYWRILPDLRLMFGGRATFWPTTIPRVARTLWNAIGVVHPQARDARIEFAWGGSTAIAFDQMPHIQRDRSIIYALGAGVDKSLAIGKTAAELILGDPKTVDSPYSEIAFPGAPVNERLYAGRPWFLPIAGEWYRFRDWRSRLGLM